MEVINFEKLYSDFKNLFDLCRYTDESLKNEILVRVSNEEIKEGSFVFRFRLVIFKFEVTNDYVEYIGYEK
ncbi:hypothetical protein IB642_02295 [Allofrancisella guangzhouensis]|uniref:Uncharacterized protein n=1 Tax=Allofrancisella guangzhouensis TaxID=594679 RepID=A0A0A8E2E8_9GAMM|nr:hypothetical protein [Allofrancisella guangzhouensis]AJC48390.1 hypothetical protein SD28_01300 [Allofrancisella guangzhouensis]MBK2026661.1 hypothetical protein [Allofrancisella guangzhouensis]MBK2043848.1 hypothetical protein [Allofrancisella guangzhouensis]MBK2045499.1 hypothetical protein [Allofrancisella guangzhouensis]